jgi:hypothetical protein
MTHTYTHIYIYTHTQRYVPCSENKRNGKKHTYILSCSFFFIKNKMSCQHKKTLKKLLKRVLEFPYKRYLAPKINEMVDNNLD